MHFVSFGANVCVHFESFVAYIYMYVHIHIYIYIHTHIYETENHSVMSDSLRPHGLYSPRNSPGQNTGMGSPSLLQGILPAQGSNPCLLWWKCGVLITGPPRKSQLISSILHCGLYKFFLLELIELFIVALYIDVVYCCRVKEFGFGVLRICVDC